MKFWVLWVVALLVMIFVLFGPEAIWWGNPPPGQETELIGQYPGT